MAHRLGTASRRAIGQVINATRAQTGTRNIAGVDPLGQGGPWEVGGMARVRESGSRAVLDERGSRVRGHRQPAVLALTARRSKESRGERIRGFSV